MSVGSVSEGWDDPEMAAERPRLTVYNEISLDGKVTGFDGDGIRYYARGFRWRSDAILMGSITAQAFARTSRQPSSGWTCRPGSRRLLPASPSSVHEPRPRAGRPRQRRPTPQLAHARRSPGTGRASSWSVNGRRASTWTTSTGAGSST